MRTFSEPVTALEGEQACREQIAFERREPHKNGDDGNCAVQRKTPLRHLFRRLRASSPPLMEIIIGARVTNVAQPRTSDSCQSPREA